MRYKLHSNITCPNPTGGAAEVFMTKKSTERKTLHAIKIDLFELPDNKKSFQNMSFFPWIKLISVLFHLKY